MQAHRQVCAVSTLYLVSVVCCSKALFVCISMQVGARPRALVFVRTQVELANQVELMRSSSSHIVDGCAKAPPPATPVLRWLMLPPNLEPMRISTERVFLRDSLCFSAQQIKREDHITQSAHLHCMPCTCFLVPPRGRVCNLGRLLRTL